MPGAGLSRGSRLVASAVGFACLVLSGLGAAGAGAAELPAGFQDSTVFSAVDEPTAIRFASDGRAFVAEKSGSILVYDSPSDLEPTLFADLGPKAYSAGDRGLLGLELDPGFPQRPYVYVLYTYDHQLGEAGEGPRWNDNCPTPPGFETNGCVVSARLARLTADGDQGGDEEILIEDWCQQFPSHSVGALQFGPEGALFASHGDGASYNGADYGQFGYPQKNPCGDPPAGVGGVQSPPSAEGGALRSQDLRTPADPTGLDGTVIRVDPESGEGLPGNPLFASLDQNTRRIVAYGFRNPFRFAISPATGEVYVGNVGAEAYDEIDRFNPVAEVPYNSGWPCLEGTEVNPVYANLGLTLCDGLYADPDASAQPFFHYDHYDGIVPEDPCPHSNGNALSGMAFYTSAGDAFPSSYEDALFFSDSVRGCIYAMFAGEDGRPDPSTTAAFLTDGGLYPGIDLEVGPEGDLYYTTLFGPGFSPGSVHRISYFSGNEPPVAHLEADKLWGDSPLEVDFDASGSTDADGDALSYEWDLDGDGVFAAATEESMATRSFADSENHSVAVRVSDPGGGSSIDRVTVYPDNTPPELAVLDPVGDLDWSVGESIVFSGEAWDEEDGVVAATSLDWNTRLFHCPDGCHAHPLEAFPAVDSGSFPAPDHEYPSYIELTLTATDDRGLAAAETVAIYPRTVELTIVTDPPGLTVGAGTKTGPSPLHVTAIQDSNLLLSVPASQQRDGRTYTWAGWSDEGERAHQVTAEAPATYEAFYSASPLDPAPVEPETEPVPPVAAPLSQPPPPPPRALLLGHPRKRAHRPTARFVFSSAPAGAALRCKLDGGEFKPCRSPRVYRDLRPGRHVLRVVAVDPASGASSAPAVFRWRVLAG